MLVIGLTGGIGSGKTTVANLFANRNIPIIDADVIARQLTVKGQPGYEAIVAHFSNTILRADGELDRNILRSIIFADPDQKLWLEKLLHPLIKEEIEREIKLLFAPYCVAVIPLLLEVDPFPFVNRTLVVDAPPHLQVERVRKRDNSDTELVEAMINAQIQRTERLARADDIIRNDGALVDLEIQVDALHANYLKLAAEAKNLSI